MNLLKSTAHYHRSLICLSLAFYLFMATAYADAYKLNDEKIEQLICQSLEIDMRSMIHEELLACNLDDKDYLLKQKNNYETNRYMAAALALGQFVFGYISFGVVFLVPIHRLYLGTNFWAVAGYTSTCGCLGLNYLVDGIMLLATNDVTKYSDNNRWFLFFPKKEK